MRCAACFDFAESFEIANMTLANGKIGHAIIAVAFALAVNCRFNAAVLDYLTVVESGDSTVTELIPWTAPDPTVNLPTSDSVVSLLGQKKAKNIRAILSQTTPGLIAATILTLIPSLGMFVVSDLLGGAKYMLVGNLIQQQFGAAADWPFGAMLGLGLIVASLVSLLVLLRWGQREGVM